MLAYVPVTINNLQQALEIQAAVFHEDFPREIVELGGKDRYGIYGFSSFYLVYENEKVIGITGLYTYKKYPQDVFMN